MTSEDTRTGGYKGDSIGKKMARVYLWLRIIHKTKHLNGRYCYLASRDGGDASVLLGMGIPASRQLAVDRDPKALAEFSEKYPDVPTACGDVDKILCSMNEKFAAIYLDFCSYGTPEIFDVCARCIGMIMPTGMFAYAAMRGREIGQSETIKSTSSTVDEMIKNRLMSDGITDDVMANLRAMVSDEMNDLGDAVLSKMRDGRYALFHKSVLSKLCPMRIYILNNTSILYHSKTDDTKGVPMMVYAWKVIRYGRGTNRIKYIKNIYSDIRNDTVLTRSEDSNRGALSGLDDIRDRNSFTADLYGVNTGNLVDFSYSIRDFYPVFDVSKILNVTTGQLAAWRAHRTQGKYDPTHVLMY